MEQVKEITPEELKAKLERGEKLQIVDVREPHEWDAGHIPQAKHIPLAMLPYRLEELDKQTPIVMVCRSGVRSHTATAFAGEHGFDAANLVGGMLHWTGNVETGP